MIIMTSLNLAIHLKISSCSHTYLMFIEIWHPSLLSYDHCLKKALTLHFTQIAAPFIKTIPHNKPFCAFKFKMLWIESPIWIIQRVIWSYWSILEYGIIYLHKWKYYDINKMMWFRYFRLAFESNFINKNALVWFCFLISSKYWIICCVQICKTNINQHLIYGTGIKASWNVLATLHYTVGAKCQYN